MYINMYIDGSRMTEKHSISEARANLPRLVREAEDGETVELTRRGKAVAVLMGRREYDRLTGQQRSFADTYAAFARDVDLAALDIDPDEMLAGTRDLSRGRDLAL